MAPATQHTDAVNETRWLQTELSTITATLGLADTATLTDARDALATMTRLTDIQQVTGLADTATIAQAHVALERLRDDLETHPVAAGDADVAASQVGHRHTVTGELITQPRPTGRPDGQWEVWIATDDPAHAEAVRVVHRPASSVRDLLADAVGRHVTVTAHPEDVHRGIIRAESIGAARTNRSDDPTESVPASWPAKIERTILEYYVRPIAQVMAGVRAPASMDTTMTPTLAARFAKLAHPVTPRGGAPRLAAAYIQMASPRIDVSAAITIAGRTYPLAVGISATTGSLNIDAIRWPTLNLRAPGRQAGIRGPLQTGFAATADQSLAGHRAKR